MPLDPTLRDQITRSVADGFDAQVADTQALIRFPSLRGEEHAIQDHVFRDWRARGYAMDRFAMDTAALAAHPGGAAASEAHSKAPIVVAIHRPREERGRSLICVAPPVPQGRRQISIRRFGSSSGLSPSAGKCSASTAPASSIAPTNPAPGVPALMPSVSAVTVVAQ